MRLPSVAASTFLVAAALASCGIADAQTGGSDRTGDTGAVSTSGASAGAKRANDRREAGGKPFKVTALGTFNEPWAMTFLPGSSDLLITEKPGRLLLRGANGRPIEVSGVPAVSYGGQGGLGDVVLHPNFRSNGLVYLSWVEAGSGGKGAVVGRGKLVRAGNAARLDGFQAIWRQSPKVSGNGHFGHRIAFGPDGMMYISTGDRQKFTPAQDLGQSLGKILRLTDSGGVPRDNPFAAQGGVAAQVWTLGHRNPLGIAFDSAGRLWEQEMGPKGGDEVNLIVKGRNYGYPNVSNGDHYDGKPIPDHSPRDGFEAPKVSWNPAISPGGLMIYSGNLFPQWKGSAFIGGLSSEALVRVALNGDRAAKGDQFPMGARIREVEQGPDGAIYVLEDGEGGRLLRLTPA
ncbi:MAG TPA: PQQ-dependent sugar dehydrogenase [Sphingomonadaceae bacterium]|nr:PQQ-dependent sugar dehydrogenase [Sphingomonadaceae bacterium]